jgi:hypothetical protein
MNAVEKDYDELLKEWSAALEAFLQTASQIPPARREEGGVCGVWSPKALLSHLAGWEGLTVEMLETLNREGPFRLDDDVDVENERFVRERADKAYEQIMDELRELGDGILKMQKKLGEHVFVHKTALEWLQIMAQEYKEHEEQLRAWV